MKIIFYILFLLSFEESFSQTQSKFRYLLRVEYMNTNLSNSSKNGTLITPNLNQDMFLLVYGNYLNEKTIFEIGITKLKHITAFSEETNPLSAAKFAREYSRTFLYLVPRYKKNILESKYKNFNLSSSLHITSTSIWGSLGLGLGVAIPENNSTVFSGLSQKVQILEDKKIPMFIGLEAGIEPTISINYRYDLSCYGRYYFGTPHRTLILDNQETVTSSFNGWSIGVGLTYKFGLSKHEDSEF
jgi:hypothetical protein